MQPIALTGLRITQDAERVNLILARRGTSRETGAIYLNRFLRVARPGVLYL